MFKKKEGGVEEYTYISLWRALRVFQRKEEVLPRNLKSFPFKNCSSHQNSEAHPKSKLPRSVGLFKHESSRSFPHNRVAPPLSRAPSEQSLATLTHPPPPPRLWNSPSMELHLIGDQTEVHKNSDLDPAVVIQRGSLADAALTPNPFSCLSILSCLSHQHLT